MDLNEMAEVHKKRNAIYTVTPEGVNTHKAYDMQKTARKPDNRFNCDKMNKAFEDVFGGGK